MSGSLGSQLFDGLFFVRGRTLNWTRPQTMMLNERIPRKIMHLYLFIDR